MKQASALLTLLIFVTLVAVDIYAMKLAFSGSRIGYVLMTLFGPITLYLAFSSILYLILYPLGRLNKYIYEQAAGPASPFASERLPTQLLEPSNSTEGH
jgi:hypothetical protein